MRCTLSFIGKTFIVNHCKLDLLPYWKYPFIKIWDYFVFFALAFFTVFPWISTQFCVKWVAFNTENINPHKELAKFVQCKELFCVECIDLTLFMTSYMLAHLIACLRRRSEWRHTCQSTLQQEVPRKSVPNDLSCCNSPSKHCPWRHRRVLSCLTDKTATEQGVFLELVCHVSCSVAQVFDDVTLNDGCLLSWSTSPENFPHVLHVLNTSKLR